MTFPLSIVIYDPGAGGAPTTDNPRILTGWIESYEDSLADEFGCETLRLTGKAASIEVVIEWAQLLMASAEVDTPAGKPRFRGFLHEVQIPALEVSVSLTDLANAVIVRWSAPGGTKGTQTASNAASIARYGRKEIVLNLSSAKAAEATNRASMVLAQVISPPNKETVTVGDGRAQPPYDVVLIFRGWCEALKWLTTSNTTDTDAVTSTQVTSLITAYNLVNPFFDTAGTITATGFSATQYCDPDTTYHERIAMLLAHGNSATQRVSWGFYTRAITIAVSASSDPSVIAYYYSKRAGELKDAYGNTIPPWDWVPNVMVQSIDLIEPPPASGAIASLTRKCIRRVTLRVDKEGRASGSLEADNPETLPEMLAKPVSVTQGTSTRHAQIESRIIRAARVRTINTDNPIIFDEDTGRLLPDGGGAPIGGGLDGSGSSPNLAKWVDSDTLTNAISGTDYAPAHAHPYAATSHDHPHTDITDWNEAVDDRVGALLVEGTNITLTYNDTANTLTVASTGGGTVGGSGAATRVAYWSDADTLTSSANLTYSSDQLNLAGANNSLQLFERDGAGSWHMYANSSTWRLYSGSDLVTVSTAGTITAADDTIVLGGFTLDLDGSLRVSGTGAALGEVLRHDGTLFVSAVLVSTDISNFNEAVDDRVDALMVDSATIVWTYTDASNTLSAAVTGVPTGSGSASRIAYWSGASALTFDTSLYYDATDNQIGIGTTSPIGNFHAKRTDGEYQFIAESSSAKYGMACSSTFFVIDDVISWPTTARRFTIDSTGQIGIAGNGNPTHDFEMGSDDAYKTATSTWGVTSDLRSKTVLGTYDRGLEFLKALPRVVSYEHNGKYGTTAGQRSMNFIAQEVEAVAPEWVCKDMYTNEDGTEAEVLRMNTHELTYAMFNSIIQLAERLERIEERPR